MTGRAFRYQRRVANAIPATGPAMMAVSNHSAGSAIRIADTPRTAVQAAHIAEAIP
jgi:hypothetical protein